MFLFFFVSLSLISFQKFNFLTFRFRLSSFFFFSFFILYIFLFLSFLFSKIFCPLIVDFFLLFLFSFCRHFLFCIHTPVGAHKESGSTLFYPCRVSLSSRSVWLRYGLGWGPTVNRRVHLFSPLGSGTRGAESCHCHHAITARAHNNSPYTQSDDRL